jgi:hypothetical protein
VSRPLLVYDGSRPAFRAAAALFTRRTDLRPVPWADPAVQSFLAAQFDDRPFVFCLVEADAVHVGRESVERALRARGAPERVVAALGRLYPEVAGPFGRVVHGREPAAIAGTFPLTEAASEALAPLRESHRIPVEEAGDPP